MTASPRGSAQRASSGEHRWYGSSRQLSGCLPARDRLVVPIIFGGAEREKAQAILRELDASTRREYEAAPTYHDGKWLCLIVDSDTMLDDVEKLLALKRKPK